jgi:hypothetical protein
LLITGVLGNIGLLSFKCTTLRLHHSTIVISLGRNRVYGLQRFERFERLERFELLQAMDPYESAKFTLRSLRIIRTLAPFAPLRETLLRNSFPAKTLSSLRPHSAPSTFFEAPTSISPNLARPFGVAQDMLCTRHVFRTSSSSPEFQISLPSFSAGPVMPATASALRFRGLATS